MRETDEIIIGRVLNGEKNAYALLVDKYKDRVFSLVKGIVKNHELAEEVSQDVFVKAYSALEKFRKDAGFSTWIYRIAYNASISAIRRKNFRTNSYDEQLDKTSAPDQLEIAEREEQKEQKSQRLKKALNELKPDERLILILYYYEEKSVEEIALSAGLSTSNVKVKLFRIRNKLKELMEQMDKKQIVIY